MSSIDHLHNETKMLQVEDQLNLLSAQYLPVVVVCLPRPMEGMGRLQLSDLFTELPVPPQAAGVVGTFNVLLYIVLSTTVSFLEDTIFFFFHFVYISIFFASTLYMCVMYLTSFNGFF